MADGSDNPKAELRAKMEAVVGGMSEAQRHEASNLACTRLVNLDCFRHASTVMLYMPLPPEVDTTAIAIRCFQRGKVVCVPRVDWVRREMTAVETAATEASDTADQLTELMGQVDAIGFETHLIALNAIIKAAHLDAGGRPLEILAQEVKILSDRTGAFVTDVKEILNAVVESRLDETPMPDESRHGGTAVEAADSRTYGIDEIADAYARFGSGSEAAAGAAESLRKALAEAPARLTFLEDLAQALAADLEIIEAASRDLEPWADPAGTAGSEETRRLAERYTMQQERGIHHEMLKTGENTPAEDAAGTSEPDLGDNVELF